MTDLYVDADAIARFAEKIGEPSGLASDATAGVTYHSTWCRISDEADGEIFRNFTGLAADAYSAVDSALSHLQTVLRDTGLELAATAEFYDTTDHETASEMD